MMPAASARSGRRRGMTLLEVMLAMGLFALLSLFIFQVVTSVLGLWQSSERRGRGDLAFTAAVERLRTDLGALHNGPRGWMMLDHWEPIEVAAGESPRRMPRLRFLARGASLPGDDAGGRSAVEVAWLLVPDLAKDGLARLVRVAQIENPGSSLRDEGTLRGLLNQGGGVPILDGVLWMELVAHLDDSTQSQDYSVPAESPFDFPVAFDLVLERVTKGGMRRPLELDSNLDATGRSMVVRGNAPLKMPPYALVGHEWVGVSGTFPRLNCSERGARGGSPLSHLRGVQVWLPEVYQADCAVSAAGRRLQP